MTSGARGARGGAVVHHVRRHHHIRRLLFPVLDHVRLSQVGTHVLVWQRGLRELTTGFQIV